MGLAKAGSDGIQRAWLDRGLGLDGGEGWWQNALSFAKPEALPPSPTAT